MSLGRGLLGSLRRRVAYETRLHRAENPAMRRARYSLPHRLLRRALSGNTFAWFLGVYLAYTLVVAIVGVAAATYVPHRLPTWKSDEIKEINGFVKDATSYLISVQVGLLAVVSIAVGLVTLIAQRDDGPSTSTDVQLYYNGALAYEVVASSVALLLVLCVQIFWPLDHAMHALARDQAAPIVKIVLTGVHLLWLAINIGAFAQFVAMSLRFVEPRARENMREQYTANVIVPDDLLRRLLPWLYLTSPKTLLPESEADTGPFISIGGGLADMGEIEILVKLKRQVELQDVRVWPLGIALRHWWRRVEAAGRPGQRPGFGRSISLILLPRFGSVEEGEAIWCRRISGVALDEWEKRLIRRSFKYRKLARIERGLPTPGDIIEELADKVIAQIDRLAMTGFNAALDELVGYHTFLLELYASHSGDGRPLSLAQFGGWEEPHQGWVRQYRRVFERAVERLVEDEDLFETLTYVPARLLPKKAAEHPAAVLVAILDIGLFEAIFLEAWVTRRTTVEVAPGGAAQPRLTLAGSDQRTYEEVVLRVIGSWERLTREVDHLYRWKENRDTPVEVWEAFSASLPYLERHLRNTAFFLVSAVWNEDEFGADRYRDMLLRWIGTFRVEPVLDYTVCHHRLLTPDLLQVDWAAVVERLTPYRLGPHGPGPSPQPLFDTILQWMLADVVILTAAVTLTWYLHEQQASDIAGQTADRLLRRQVIEEEGTQFGTPDGHPIGTFDRVFSVLIREDLVTRLAPGRYGTRLDELVRFLSQMSERRVVPGRIYSSMGLHGVDDVTQALLVMLLAHVPEDGDNRLVNTIGEIAAKEDLFADRDEALRRIAFSMEQLGSKLADQAGQPRLERGVQLLAPNAVFAAAVVRLQAIITASKEVIGLRRLERLKARAPDPEKLGTLRDRLEYEMGGVEGQFPIFRGFHIGHAEGQPRQTNSWKITGIDKGELVTPPLSQDTGLFKAIAERFIQGRGKVVWQNFCQIRRKPVRIAASRYPVGFWKKVGELAVVVGPDPVLLVPFTPIGRDISNWQYNSPAPEGLNVEIRPNQPTGAGFGYRATIDGVNVYTINLPSDRAWLFSAHMLRSIRYSSLPSGNLVDLSFEEGGNPHNSTFVVSFAQTVEWSDLPIVELVLRSRATKQAAVRVAV